MTANQIAYWSYHESGRHNRISEKETQRHNEAMEAIQAGQVAESVRSNKARELENSRHNIATEQVNYYIAESNTAHMEKQDAEAQRHNMAMESRDLLIVEETNRHNIATESQTSFKLWSDNAFRSAELDQGWADLDIKQQRADTERSKVTWDNIWKGVNTANNVVGLVE